MHESYTIQEHPLCTYCASIVLNTEKHHTYVSLPNPRYCILEKLFLSVLYGFVDRKIIRSATWAHCVPPWLAYYPPRLLCRFEKGELSFDYTAVPHKAIPISPSSE